MMNNLGNEIENWGSRATHQVNDEIDHEGIAAGDRNRLWWERLPMTYLDWDSKDRMPKSREDFQGMDDLYFGTNPYLTTDFDFGAFRGCKVLEIGCGAGSAACRFAQQGARVTAVDLTQAAVELTALHASVLGIRTIDVRQMDAENLDGLPAGTFDFVYSWGVLHHSPHPQVCFREAQRVMRSGGQGLIMVYHRGSLRYWLKGLYWLLLRGKLLEGYSLSRVQRFFTDGYYHKHYSRSCLRHSLAEAGFQVDRIAVTHMRSRMMPFIPESLKSCTETALWLAYRSPR